MESTSVTYSITDKSVNQDSHESCGKYNGLLNVVAIADGVGSSVKAEVASSFLTKTALSLLKTEEFTGENVNQSVLFERLHEALCKQISCDYPNEDNSKSFRSTFILAIEYEDYFDIAYTGNGSIFHWRGNFWDFSKHEYLPFSCLSNYLNPHSIIRKEDNEEVLVKYFSPLESKKNLVKPTVIRVSKDNEDWGDVLMICTDGIYTYDQVVPALSSEPIPDFQKIRWIKYSPRYSLILDYFREHFTASEPSTDAQSLENVLKDALKRLLDENMLDDDATVGMIFTGQFLKQFQDRNESVSDSKPFEGNEVVDESTPFTEKKNVSSAGPDG